MKSDENPPRGSRVPRARSGTLCPEQKCVGYWTHPLSMIRRMRTNSRRLATSCFTRDISPQPRVHVADRAWDSLGGMLGICATAEHKFFFC